MKKLFAILLIAALAVTLVACGGTQELIVDITDETLSAEDTAAVRETYDKADAYVSALLPADIESQVQDDEGGEAIYKSWFNDVEAGELSLDIDIAGNAVTVGTTTVKDVEGFAGVTVQKNAEEAEPEMPVSINIFADNKFADLISETNHSAEAQSGDDFAIIEVVTGNGEYSLDFNYCDLTLQSTLKDVLDTLGTAGASVNLSAESYATRIEVNYLHSVENGSEITDTSLTFTLLYDADSDTATMEKISLRHETYTI